jgi:hypothetical protein
MENEDDESFVDTVEGPHNEYDNNKDDTSTNNIIEEIQNEVADEKCNNENNNENVTSCFHFERNLEVALAAKEDGNK